MKETHASLKYFAQISLKLLNHETRYRNIENATPDGAGEYKAPEY
jgi:hypothetical protein